MNNICDDIIENIIPNDFDLATYQKIMDIVFSSKIIDEIHKAEFAGAWNNVLYRYIEFCQSNNEFVKCLREHSNTPTTRWRYEQERSLFNFFTCGLSIIESYCYAVYVICSIVKYECFPLIDPDDRNLVKMGLIKQISLDCLAKKLSSFFTHDKITIKINEINVDNSFKSLKIVRNALCHRSTPGRLIFGTTRDKLSKPPEWTFRNNVKFTIDENLTEDFQTWLSKKLRLLFADLEIFINENVKDII